MERAPRGEEALGRAGLPGAVAQPLGAKERRGDGAALGAELAVAAQGHEDGEGLAELAPLRGLEEPGPDRRALRRRRAERAELAALGDEGDLPGEAGAAAEEVAAEAAALRLRQRRGREGRDRREERVPRRGQGLGIGRRRDARWGGRLIDHGAGDRRRAPGA